MCSPVSNIPRNSTSTVRIRLNPDRSLAGPPQVISTGTLAALSGRGGERPSRRRCKASPTRCCRDEPYEQWKYMDIDFDPKQMFRS